MRNEQPEAAKGSQKWLQVLVNRRPELINRPIAERLDVDAHRIRWLSPLEDDGYAEYRDGEFVDRLGVVLDKRPLRSFWPRHGPVWDGLAKAESGALVLVEAKAHIPELVTDPTGAKSARSLSTIRASLDATKSYLGISSTVDWSASFYQYTNRLAHLYLLRVLNDLPAYLAFVHFINARDVDGPETEAEWKGAIRLLEESIGLRRKHRLSPYVIHAFVDVLELEATEGG